jgi:16S rRNA U516 pseudouridylate synthase RsuA-like enzyme
VFSKAGIGSRTGARSWIGKGRIRVNGRIVKNPDHRRPGKRGGYRRQERRGRWEVDRAGPKAKDAKRSQLRDKREPSLKRWNERTRDLVK